MVSNLFFVRLYDYWTVIHIYPIDSTGNTKSNWDNFFASWADFRSVNFFVKFVQSRRYINKIFFRNILKSILWHKNAFYLFAMKKELIQKGPRFTILFIFLISSVMVCLQVYIFSLGFSFTMAYEASPANDLLSRFGRIGYVITGPLYLAICCLCIYIKGKQLEIRTN